MKNKEGKKYKIYIDVSNLMSSNFVSGIQRVVREVVLRMLHTPDMELTLLQYDRTENAFRVLDNQRFGEYFGQDKGKREEIATSRLFGIGDFENGEIFFEIDSAWYAPYKRMDLYPVLKNRGVKIVVFFHDIIPLLWPEYAEQMTVAAFMGFFCAALTHGDLFLTSTKTNVTYLQELSGKLGVKLNVPCEVTWLGMDFKSGEAQGNIRRDVEEVCGGDKFVLMVGTLEPRKNHKLVLDAFDNGLFEKGVKLVFAGKLGWNVPELKQRIQHHPMLGKSFFFVEKATDAEIELLYQSCYMVAFPSFTEGFGLPVTESCARGVPVIASNQPIIREVGGEWCEYISPDKPEEFCACVERYLGDEKAYSDWRKRLEDYQVTTWDEVEQRMENALRNTFCPTGKYEVIDAKDLVQMVVLTARAEDLLRSLPYVERYMPFIQEVVIGCPEKTKKTILETYEGNLQIKCFTDEEILEGEALPEDHAARNIFLRARLLAKKEIRNAFLMSDDDYRPLREIQPDYFVRDGKYIGRYCHDLVQWRGAQGVQTSFDKSMLRARDFLTKHDYPTYMFDAHMPQVIDKRIFLETLERYPEIMYHSAASEWNGYFNYMAAEYPELVEIEPYTTLNWPGYQEDWEPGVQCSDYLFENFYEGVYQEATPYGNKGLFNGLQTEYTEQAEEENACKIQRGRRAQQEHRAVVAQFEQWKEDYCREYGAAPVFALAETGEELRICLPENLAIAEGGFLRIPVQVLRGDWMSWAMPQGEDKKDGIAEEWQLTWGIYQDNRLVQAMGAARFLETDSLVEVLVVAPRQSGTYRMEWNLFTGKNRVYHAMILTVNENTATDK